MATQTTDAAPMPDQPITPVTPVLPTPVGQPDPTPRQRWISIIAALLLAVIALVLFATWPRGGEPTGTDGASQPGESSGGGVIGAGPDGAATTGTAAPSSGPSAGPSASASASTSAASTAASASPSVASAPFTAVAEKRQGANGLLSVIIDVTVTNPGTHAGSWQSVGVSIGGLTLLGAVSSADAAYTHEARGTTHCFRSAAGPVTLEPGATVTFMVTVTGVAPGALNVVSTAGVDSSACA